MSRQVACGITRTTARFLLAADSLWLLTTPAPSKKRTALAPPPSTCLSTTREQCWGTAARCHSVAAETAARLALELTRPTRVERSVLAELYSHKVGRSMAPGR